MDKSWMLLGDRLGRDYIEYAQGVKSFLEFASESVDSRGFIKCPCKKCKNLSSYNMIVVEDHLFVNRIDPKYSDWVLHGEPFPQGVRFGGEFNQMDECNEIDMDDINVDVSDDNYDNGEDMTEMLGDLGTGIFGARDGEGTSTQPSGGNENFGSLWEDAQRELYEGCTRHTKLSFTVRLLHIKSICRISAKAIDMLLELFKETLPPDNVVPRNFYEAKKLKRGLGFDYNIIHACKNDCVLFWKQNAEFDSCPVCHESRWTSDKRNVPHKVLRHFPLIPRLQRLFTSRMTATDMNWHHTKRVHNDQFLTHPADSLQWKKFDDEYPWFAEEPRNVRLGLATDGFNPFGNMSTSHSTWPVILMPYNLPPWKCMKDPYFMMTLLIPGPRSPGNEIDVYLQPMIAELKELWEQGVNTYDAALSREFKMHAAVLWTINDFPAYGNLSGWSTKGKMACPICNKDTQSQ